MSATIEPTLALGREVQNMLNFWKRLAGLEIEEALKEGNFSPDEIQLVLSWDSYEELYLDGCWTHLKGDIDKTRLALAVIGRDHRSAVKSLAIDSHNIFTEDDVIALCANLSSNSKVEKVDLTNQGKVGTLQACKLLGNALKTNATLRNLSFNFHPIGSDEAVKFLIDGLKQNKVLEFLSIAGISGEWVAHVAELLQTNITLKRVHIRVPNRSSDSGKSMSSALAHNTTLEELLFTDGYVGNMDPDAIDMILRVLTPMDGSADGSIEPVPENRTLKHLGVSYYPSNVDHIEAVASLIKRNKILTTLDLSRSRFSSEEWVELVAALNENYTLETLSLEFCSGLSEDVFQAFMQLVQSGRTGLENVDVNLTEISEHQGQINEELRINKEYRSKLSGQTDLVQPKSARLVLCGFEFGGKTTLCKTMVRVGKGQSTTRRERWKMAWKNFVKQFPRVRVFLFGQSVLRELKHRTRGIDIVTISDESSRRFFAWDFAGQKEYYALHDYMFPNVQNSCFLYVCNPTVDSDQSDHHAKMSDQVFFWLRFIASNCKPIQGSSLPTVHFVMTNKDRLDSSSLDSHTLWAVGVVAELKEKFKDKIDIREPQVVNAQSYEDVLTLLPVVKGSLRELLLQPTEYSACADVREILESWAIGNGGSQPILRLPEFEKMAARKVHPDILEAALAYLNDLGEIIFMKSMNFVVVSPRWFGVGILGPLVNAFRGAEMPGQEWKGVVGCLSNSDTPTGLPHRNGFVERPLLDHLLKVSLKNMDLATSITREELIKLIIHLEMAFEEPKGSLLFIPAVFDDPQELAAKGQRELIWTKNEQFRSGDIYIGRRLQCEDETLTFLTPGFFPRLQVVLRNYLHSEKWTENAGFQVDRNLIRFQEDDMQVVVEYNSIDSFVDILVKSFQPFQKTVQFVQEHVLSNILSFCASPRGCQGVQLVEAVIRPVCVEELYRCDLRKEHAVKVSELRRRIEKYGRGSKHTWKESIRNVSESDVALVLLEGQHAYKEWEMFAANQLEGQEVQVPHPTFAPLYPSETLGDFPRSFFATIEDITTISRLGTRGNQILAKVVPINLHLLCDDGNGKKHIVDGQPGRLLKLNSTAGNNLPLMKLAISILWTGLRVGATIAGVPSFPTTTIDTWVDSLFEVPQMDISSDNLVKYMGRGGSIQVTVSEESILNALNRYLKLDPSTLWLKGFLDLQNNVKFKEDFKMRKVKYTIGSSSSTKFGWLCEPCYLNGLNKGILQEGSD